MRAIGIMGALLVGGLNAASSQTIHTAEEPTVYAYCQQFQTLYTQIREQRVEPDSARRQFSSIMLGLRSRFRSAESAGQAGGDQVNPGQAGLNQDSLRFDSLYRAGQYFSFPIRGYAPSAIGGTHGEGYRGKGFDLFDYNVRGSHPAQDIFIADRNQDVIDDRTGKAVDILAMSSGLILGIETAWQPGSEYRGGNWIWLYDPTLNGLFYYAHNNRVDVTPGQWVQAGQKIAEMGRSGFNAYKARSPTHLHLMYLQIQPDGLPRPVNTYTWLLAAKSSK